MNRLPYVELNDFNILPSVSIPALFQDDQVNDILKNNDTVVFTKQDSDYAVEVEVVQWFKLKEGTYKYDLRAGNAVKITSKDDSECEFEVIDLKFDVNAKTLKQMSELYETTAKTYADNFLENGLILDTLAELSDEESIYYCAQCLEVSDDIYLSILKQDSINEVLETLLKEIDGQALDQQVEYELTKSLRDDMEKQQREYILREKKARIEKELGDEDEDDTKKFDEQLENLKASDEIKLKIKRELKKFKKLPNQSGEKGPTENYLRTMLDLPWENYTKDDNSLDKAKEILDRDHYGMTDVKDRILEYLAVRSLNKNGDDKGTVLCLSGAPGIGKTSIAKSLADSLGRTFQKVSLGGVTDESAIRGHRRTYVGSMPGKLIQAIRKAGTSNPVILLDEIDKLGSDSMRGDPSAAMLEVLDPSQNHKFEDHYLDCEYDLSKVIFIATANYLEKIPHALRDRLEIINMSGYTINEKVKIASNHLLERAKKDNNISNSNVTVDEDTLTHIIKGYTKEAGVRNLQRAMNTICRKIATKSVIEGTDISNFTITKEFVKEALGIVKFDGEEIEKENQVGLVNGMYYSAAGGGVLNIHALKLPGEGKVTITGNLKDVMKESSTMALSYVKSIAANYNVHKDFFKEHDIHIHSGDLSTPKDGPSASMTMMTAILSAASNKRVKQNFAMTGESNLFGKAMPIGGVKEKILGAKLAGVTDIIIPKANEKDLEDVSEEILEGLTIHSVDNVKQVFDLVLE